MRSNDLSRPRALHRRFPRVVSALCIGAVGLGVAGAANVAGAATPPNASATSMSSPTTLSGHEDLHSPSVGAVGGGVTASFDLLETLSWSQPAQVSTTFERNQIRQGRSPALKSGVAVTGSGTMSVSWTLHNLKASFDGSGMISLGSPSFSASAPCNLMTGGGPYDCALSSGTTALVSTPYGYHGPYVSLRLKADITVTPQELATMRSLVGAGTAGAPVRLSVGEAPVTDTSTFPCTAFAGGDINYDLGTISAAEGVSVLNSLVFDAGTAAPAASAGVEALTPFAHPTVAVGPVTGSMIMSGPGVDFDLGSLLANNLPPKASAGGPYSGTVGVPIAFDGTRTTDVCGVPELEWTFSDGGLAYGENPQHTFASPGLFSGRLTVTDASGLTSSTTFEVQVTAAEPVVAAGPDQTTEWGLPVSFNGTATESAAGATVSLAGSWTFGDGAAADGASATHEYATPGLYTATFTSCDPSNLCKAATARLTVTKRGTTAAYTGATASDVDGRVTYAASVLDDLGDPVAGVDVGFYADGSSAPFTSGVTNSMGFAFATSAFPRGLVGSHTITARFAGDSSYTGSAYGPVAYIVHTDGSPAGNTDGAAVGNTDGSAAGNTGSTPCNSATSCTTPSTIVTGTRLGTTIAYTGATASDATGKVIYAASVLDAQGDPVAGRVVDFYADGSETPFTSAVTNSMGFAFETAVFPRDTAAVHTVTARFAGDWRYTGSSYGPVPYSVNTDGSAGVVMPRGTTIAYTGATASEVTGHVLYAASVLDDLGDPVAGGVVDFYADGSATPFTSAVTNSMGFAFAISAFPGGTTSIHTVTARYAGNADYTESSYGPVPYSLSMAALSGG